VVMDGNVLGRVTTEILQHRLREAVPSAR